MDDASLKEALLNQRYGCQTAPANVIWNSQVAQMLSHRSVRTFLNEPLPDGALETMVAAAQSASSSSNLHQWSVVAVSDEHLKQQVATTIAKTLTTDRIPWIEECAALLLWVADASRSAEITRDQGGDPQVLGYLDAFLMAAIDTALAAQNASVAAESIGLGVVFLGVMRNAAKEIAELIRLPPHSFVAFGMAVGRPDPTRPNHIRPRPVQEVVLHRDGYHRNRYRNHIESYEEAFRAFREKSNMRKATWKEAVHTSTTSMAYMSGREKLREMVTERGFSLR